MKCKFCGCTDRRACPGGCSWTRPEVCSQCADAAINTFSPLRVRYLFDTMHRPRGLPLEKGVTRVTYQRDGVLNFVPFNGIEIDVGDGDLRRVLSVHYWPAEARLQVYFEDEDAERSHRFMLQQGWALA